MTEPFMVYFGPFKEPGHFFFTEEGYSFSSDKFMDVPWRAGEIDGPLQPGWPLPADRLQRRTRPMCEGEAHLHHRNGWTALSFWDFSVDTRPGSSSTYIAKGIFTFEQMVELAKTRFAERWNRFKAEVKLVLAVEMCQACGGRGAILKSAATGVHTECGPCGGKGYVNSKTMDPS